MYIVKFVWIYYWNSENFNLYGLPLISSIVIASMQPIKKKKMKDMWKLIFAVNTTNDTTNGVDWAELVLKP